MNKKIESHIHTIYCNHAKNSPDEMIDSSIRKGFESIGFSEHLNLSYLAERGGDVQITSKENFASYYKNVKEAQKKYRGKIEVRIGAEADYLSCFENDIKKEIAKFDFDYVMGSIHFIGAKVEYVEYANRELVVSEYFKETKKLISSGLFDVLSHPFLVQYSHGLKEKDFTEEFDEIVRLLKKQSMSVDFNTSRIKDSDIVKMQEHTNPGHYFLTKCVQNDIPLVLGSDAHNIDKIGYLFEESITILKKLGIKKLAYYKNRKPIYYDI